MKKIIDLCKLFIYFDTNNLRSISDKEVVYNKFELSNGFYRIENYLKRTSLSNNVTLAISEIVLMELIEQKINQYNSDKENYYKLKETVKTKYEKLKEMDEKISMLTQSKYIEGFELKVKDYSFDCPSAISEMAKEYISKKEIEIVKVPEETPIKATIFDSMIKRAIRKQYPFQKYNSNGKNFSDAGFKDVLIWESLLNYNGIKTYDEVIFVTGDNVFINCISEFNELVS
ncbi:PIN domain-containing protein [Methanosarcina sp. 1.H.A.2.2]|uniref:PIN domain-containing protein n=1 Tax=Methanosarcina sp. 1.H.A.2.2 TaxID=1483601 RepID=UPI000621197B|nr:PIN domain-containing protein [Methanosarcina sp. 1.H.A.2.2]KKH48012.1 hypothetical protein EO93_00335 [Methanosarcina sp. 1.H.A.2.2]